MTNKMTNEEAIEFIETDISRLWNTPQNLKHKEALEMARDALKQKSCTDAISRQAVLDEMYKRKADGDTITAGFIKNLLPVTPQPKMGRWIEEINDYGEITCWHCDKCYEDSGFTTTCKWAFCPNCGQPKMQEVEK